MEIKKVSFLRTRILEWMAKYIGCDDLGYVTAKIISEERAEELEYEFTDKEFKGTSYVISIKLSKEEN